MSAIRPIFLLLLLMVATAGCDNRYRQDIPSKPEGMLDKATFIELHAELQLLEAAHRQRMLRGGERDATRAAHRKRILADAGVSDSAFSATYDWWYSQPEALPGLLEEVLLTLDSIERASASN